MKVLLSIKPIFAEKILNGIKKYEFRKSIFKRDDIHKVVVYASAPVKQVIGEFNIEEILNDDVDTIWKKTANEAGISKKYYQDYFDNKERAYAIKIGATKRYQHAKPLSDYNIKCAPQSFMYIN